VTLRRRGTVLLSRRVRSGGGDDDVRARFIRSEPEEVTNLSYFGRRPPSTTGPDVRPVIPSRRRLGIIYATRTPSAYSPLRPGSRGNGPPSERLYALERSTAEKINTQKCTQSGQVRPIRPSIVFHRVPICLVGAKFAVLKTVGGPA